MSRLSRFFKRFSQDEADVRAGAIREWARAVPGAVPIDGVAPRTVVLIAGVVEAIRVRPREGVQAVEAVVTDGSGTVTAVWLGRRSLPGLSLGRRMILEGRFGGSAGQLQVVNPRYEFATPAIERD